VKGQGGRKKTHFFFTGRAFQEQNVGIFLEQLGHGGGLRAGTRGKKEEVFHNWEDVNETSNTTRPKGEKKRTKVASTG